MEIKKINKKDLKRILMALYTINKGAKRVRDKIWEIEKNKRINEGLKEYLIEKLENKKSDLYWYKEYYLGEVKKIKGVNKYIKTQEKHIILEGQYETDLVGDYINFEIDGVNYDFHYNLRWEIIDYDEREKMIKLEGLISSKNEKGYKSTQWAQHVLEKYFGDYNVVYEVK